MSILPASWAENALDKARRTQVDWSAAPPLAAAYIAVSVGDGTHGCWLLDDGTRRRWAPAFGIELEAGQTWSMRRPGHEINPTVLHLLQGWYWRHIAFNDKLEILPPEDGYERPMQLKGNRLAVATRLVLHRPWLPLELGRMTMSTHG